MTAAYNPAEIERLVREAVRRACLAVERTAATAVRIEQLDAIVDRAVQESLAAMADQLEAARAEVERQAKRPLRTFDQIAADRLADEVAVLVRRKVIDARSPAGDALLDYRDPPPSPRADRMAMLERERDAALADLARLSAELKAARARIVELETALAQVRQ